MSEKDFAKARKKLIVALDTSDEKKLKKLLKDLGETVDIFKVGLEQYLASRGKVLDLLKKKNKKVFLDLKFHDIPNTMAAAARRAVSENVWMFNIHVTGSEAMRQVMNAAQEEAKKLEFDCPKIIGVTVLTSLSDEDLKQLGYENTAAESVLTRANLAKEAGLDGVVSSAKEAASIKNEVAKDFITVCPGVRPVWASKGDQKRIMTPSAAIKEGADYLVVGRPITQSDNPAESASKILSEMEEVL
ncbi:orotidine-5'-phosphate decarboxylase [Natronospora cellulosivora (SeqCode)]